jgi:hypothetical protein
VFIYVVFFLNVVLVVGLFCLGRVDVFVCVDIVWCGCRVLLGDS